MKNTDINIGQWKKILRLVIKYKAKAENVHVACHIKYVPNIGLPEVLHAKYTMYETGIDLYITRMD